MLKQNWRTWVGSALLTSGLLTVFTVNVYAQSAAPQARAVVVNAATSEPGVLISAVEADSPAAQAGIKRGDIILAVNSKPVNTPQEIKEALRAKQTGDKLTLQVQHGDDQKQIEVTIGERAGQAYLGVLPAFGLNDQVNMVEAQGMPMPGMPAIPGMPGGPGMNTAISQTVSARVMSVEPEGPAATAEIQPGDLIVAVDGHSLSPAADLSKLIGGHKPGDKIVLKVQQGGPDGQTVERTVTLGKKPTATDQPYLGVRVATVVTYQMDQVRLSRSATPVPGVRPPLFWFAQPGQLYAQPPFWIMPFGGWFGMAPFGNFGFPWQNRFLFTQPALPMDLQDNVQVWAEPSAPSMDYLFEAPLPPDLPLPGAAPNLEVPVTPDGSDEVIDVVL